MVEKNETVTVGAIRELTALEIAEREITAGKPSNYSRDAKEAHADAVAISKMGENSMIFSTEGIQMHVVGQQVEAVETVTTKSERPKATIKGEPEVMTEVRILLDWRDGQGLLHTHGKVIELPPNEATRLLGERRAERVNPPKHDDSAEKEAKAAVEKAQSRIAAASKSRK
ncbi:MAG: hypothetical protein H0T60_18680 [Acidobacteria bacterium]|nr:hypothetical protein [Acidobacteriota bacterium]